MKQQQQQQKHKHEQYVPPAPPRRSPPMPKTPAPIFNDPMKQPIREDPVTRGPPQSGLTVFIFKLMDFECNNNLI